MEVIDSAQLVARYILMSLDFLLHVRKLRDVALMQIEPIMFVKRGASFCALQSSLLSLSHLSQLR